MRDKLRPSFEESYKEVNILFNKRLDNIDTYLIEYNDKHPNCITKDVIHGILKGQPLTRKKWNDIIPVDISNLVKVNSAIQIGDSVVFLSDRGLMDMRRWSLVGAVRDGRMPRLGGTRTTQSAYSRNVR